MCCAFLSGNALSSTLDLDLAGPHIPPPPPPSTTLTVVLGVSLLTLIPGPATVHISRSIMIFWSFQFRGVFFFFFFGRPQQLAPKRVHPPSPLFRRRFGWGGKGGGGAAPQRRDFQFLKASSGSGAYVFPRSEKNRLPPPDWDPLKNTRTETQTHTHTHTDRRERERENE